MKHCTRSIITVHVQIITNTESVNLFLSKNVSVLLREGLESNKTTAEKRGPLPMYCIPSTVSGMSVTQGVFFHQQDGEEVYGSSLLKMSLVMAFRLEISVDPCHGFQICLVSCPQSWVTSTIHSFPRSLPYTLEPSVVQSLLGGSNFILSWNFNRNQTENDRRWQKNNVLLFAKCLKMYSFFAFAFKVCKKCYYDPKMHKNENTQFKQFFGYRAFV